MNTSTGPRRGIRFASALACIVAVAVLLGCATKGEDAPTLAEAETATTEIVDGVIASIEPASIERVDVVTNDTLSCRGSDVDPEGKVRVWENLRYVWLSDGTNKLELLDTLVKAAADEGWELVRDKAANADGGRRVQLQGIGDRAEYVLQFVSGAEGDGQNVVYVSSGSPCFEVPVER